MINLAIVQVTSIPSFMEIRQSVLLHTYTMIEEGLSAEVKTGNV